MMAAKAQPDCFFTHYSSEDGLSQNTVMGILQDYKGNMWFATWNGLNKFDGYSFKVYKAKLGSQIALTNDRMDQICEDKFGFLWLQTYDNHAYRFDPSTERFERVPAENEPGFLSTDFCKINTLLTEITVEEYLCLPFKQSSRSQ